jgi:hypothetical protein
MAPFSDSTPSSSHSKFKEHLSVSVPLENLYIGKSQFSPDSPPPTHSKNSSCTITNNFQRCVDKAHQSSDPISGGFRDRVARVFFNLRTFRRKDPELLPSQGPRETTRGWPPLRIEKRLCACHHKTEKQKKRRRWTIIALVILLLYMFANIVALNIRVFSPLPTRGTLPTSSNSSSLSEDATQCISQYNLNAPANPDSYPCSSCLPILQSIPSDFSFSNVQDSQTTQNAIQFCGLKALFDSASSDGQSSLSNGGFMKDVKFCAWNGVACDGAGQISSMYVILCVVSTKFLIKYLQTTDISRRSLIHTE